MTLPATVAGSMSQSTDEDPKVRSADEEVENFKTRANIISIVSGFSMLGSALDNMAKVIPRWHNYLIDLHTFVVRSLCANNLAGPLTLHDRHH